MNIEDFIRPNIRGMKPYSSARDEFSGDASVFLDANENPYPLPYHRYPDPHQKKIKQRLASLKSVSANQIFLGNGSDEPIDLIIRMCCIPGENNLIAIDPSYGMYQVSAAINDVEVRKAALSPTFELDLDTIREATDNQSRLLFLCSPNNPSGNSLNSELLEMAIRTFPGLVVLDEAYADFSNQSLLPRLNEFENLIILQTFSKAWGMAGLRVGLAYASPLLISYLNKIKPPYNINQVSQEKVLMALENVGEMNERVNELIAERERLHYLLKDMKGVEKVYPSDANFLLVKFKKARELFQFLLNKGIILRDRSGQRHCDNCLRITIGTPEENTILIDAINTFQ
jgi:histidinol-phosphate aminotransferase